MAQIVGGVAEGCVQAGCALVGGETAEMPGFYPEDEYDLAGFSVGVVDKSKILDKETMQEGDVLIALPSSGVHSNGFSLVRKVFQVEKGGLDRRYADLGQTLGETLLTPTRIYVKPVLALLKAGVRIRSISHITGGGFYENIPRSLAEGMTARIERSAVRVLPIFEIIAREGGILGASMFRFLHLQHGRGHVPDGSGGGRRSGAGQPGGRGGERRICAGRDRARRRRDRTMLNIAVLVSGGGTNLQALLDAQAAGTLKSGRITLVVSSKEGAYALTRAQNAGVETAVLAREGGETPAAYGERLIALLRAHDIGLVVLAGFMLILDACVIRAYEGRILNVHPSLIPAFCGEGYYGLRVPQARRPRGVKR